MHLSRMRTARLLTVSQHALRRGVYLSMHWTGGCLPGGVCLPREGYHVTCPIMHLILPVCCPDTN